MLFKKKDQVQKLISQARADQTEYAALRTTFEGLAPKWNKAQTECERIEGLRNSRSGTYAREVSEEFWAARDAILERELKAAIAARDALTGAVCASLQSLKLRIFHRHSLISGAFGSWAAAVCDRLPENSSLRADLMAARKQIEVLRDMSEIIDLIIHWTELVENLEGVFCPVLKFDLVAIKALGIGEPEQPVAV
jgi:hypothetical protein